MEAKLKLIKLLDLLLLELDEFNRLLDLNAKLIEESK